MVDQLWVANIPPPTDVRVNGKPESAGMATKSTGSVTVCASIVAALSQQNAGKNRIRIRWTSDNWETHSEKHGPWITPATSYWEDQFCIDFNNLKQNTHFRMRLWTERVGFISKNYNSIDFWTNRPPNPPEIIQPTENAQFTVASTINFDWRFSDPDPGEDQHAYRLRIREAPGRTTSEGAWQVWTGDDNTTRNIAGSNFKGNHFYEWQIQVQDNQGSWSGWSLIQSFYMLGSSTPPALIAPSKGEAVDISEPVLFQWRFRDPNPGDSQVNADLRYRAVGTSDWFLFPGVGVTDEFLQVPGNTFIARVHYEWQARTYDAGSGGATASDWSVSETFYSIHTPGSSLLDAGLIPDRSLIQGALGCGTHRAFIYAQGGEVLVGEIKPLRNVMWSRKRDDIANAVVDTNGFDYDCGQLLGGLRSWQHELVIFRDDERVFEGPITRITYTVDNVEIEAKDVMAYVYRRVMRQGYNDSYRCLKKDAYGNCIPGYQLGLTTVVKRAARIIINALARSDPNVLPYLTILTTSTDARQSRVAADYSKTAWEEVDDLASVAGLDYVTAGRRIILWDTHYPIGKLPEMRDEHFSNPVIVTEYGMNLANYFAVTNGNGVWGAAIPLGTIPPDETPGPGEVGAFDYYGPIEQLASAYGETEAVVDQVLTAAALAKLEESMASQARRNIAHRWTTPLIVRVPDNSSITPETNLGINQLIPGVWIPLRATATCRTVAQWQKLDSVTVEEVGGQERVQVVMSPAPNGGNDDPDATTAGEEV